MGEGMNILILLKYIPSRDEDLKSDCIWSICDGLAEQGQKVTLATKGKSAPHSYPQVNHEALVQYLEDPENEENPFLDELPDATLAICTDEYPALLAHRIFQVLKVPYIMQEHRTYYDRKYLTSADVPARFLSAIRDAMGVYAVSLPLARTMELRGVRQDVGVLPNSLPETFFRPSEPAEYSARTIRFLDWAGADYVFGAWTNWRSIKRVDVLLDAFRFLQSQNQNVRLIVAGPLRDPMNEGWVSSYLEDHDLNDRVLIFGAANRSEIHAIAHRVDCCVVPSDFETFSLPALEAQAAGKPVIATRCNGPEDIISSPVLGRLVERQDPEQMASQMMDVISEKDSFDSRMISRSAYDRFSRTAVSREFLRALRLCVSGNARVEETKEYSAFVPVFKKDMAAYILFQRTELLPQEEKERVKKLGLGKGKKESRRAVVLDYAERNSQAVGVSYLKRMEEEYERLRLFLPSSAKRILDVGCGVAGFDLFLHRHYLDDDPLFYLLDKTGFSESIWYGFEKEGAFYNSLELARDFLIGNGVNPSRVVCIEASNDGTVTSVPPDCDLVISTLSWGFHYPVSMYIDSVYDLLRPGGFLILDVRSNTDGHSDLLRKFDTGNVEPVSEGKKYVTYRCVKQG